MLQVLGVQLNSDYRAYLRAVKKCDYCAPVFPSEEPIIRKHCGFGGRFLRFSYGDYATDSDHGEPTSQDAQDILVGNSSFPTSNHIDAFEQLAKLNLGDRRLVVPLNYGDTDHRDFVIRAGRNMFGSRFVPLVQFMRFEDYSSLIKQCGVFVLNHGRQQAGGNILMGLWNGARICLREENPAYAYFLDVGARVFSINRELTQELLENPLSKEVVASNRAVVRKEYGREPVLQRVRSVVEVLNGN